MDTQAEFDERVRASRRAHAPVGGTPESRLCVTCGTVWPCRDALWQEQWLNTLNLEIEQEQASSRSVAYPAGCR